MTRLVLASQSPRRRELLALTGYPFEVLVADADEGSVSDPDPARNALATARLKAQTVAGQLTPGNGRTLILGADTIVMLDAQELGKPTNGADARTMLTALRGRTHAVHTGMILIDPANGVEATAIHTALVTMRHYSDHEVEQYVASGDPFDKAGAYAIQSPSFQPVASLAGCYLGVMGLCVCQLPDLLRRHDLHARFDMKALAAAHRGYDCPDFAKIAQKQSK